MPALAPKEPREIVFQERDFAILRGLFESRIMTAEHIAALYFDGRAEATKKRLQKLKAAGLIRERVRRVSEPAVLFLTEKGFRALSNHGQLAEYPKRSATSWQKRADVSDLTVRHELDVMSVKAAVVQAINRTDRFRVTEFSTWPALYQFKARRSVVDPTKAGELIVKPDGFIRVHEDEPAGGLSEHAFFLEVDRSSETLEILVQKALYYRDFYKRGGLAERNGAPRSDYKKFPFLVLFVCKSEARRDNAIERLLESEPPILTQVWLTTIHEVVTDPLGPIWVRPKNYREVNSNKAKGDLIVTRLQIFNG